MEVECRCNLLIITGVSLSKARMQVTVSAIRLDRSRFVRQLRIIGDVGDAITVPLDLDASIKLCEMPIILLIGLFEGNRFF